MKFLFNSLGDHIVIERNGQLYAPSGKNIGHYIESKKIFIDMKGFYLGEIVATNRLLYRIDNAYINTCFGAYGDYENIGNYGNRWNCGSIGQVSGFEDIVAERLI